MENTPEGGEGFPMISDNLVVMSVLMLLVCVAISGVAFAINTLESVLIGSTVTTLFFVRAFIWVGDKLWQ